MKKYLVIVLAVGAFLAGLWFSRMQWLPSMDKVAQQEAVTILNKIEQVTKLITVDGYFSEVYDYKDYYGYDWKIFRKKALIRVKAKVSAGYDLSSINVATDSETKTVRLSALPEVQILSVDHDLDYYDLSEGTFNSFSEADLNRLNDQAKSYIEEVARQSDLMTQAEAQGQEVLDVLRFLVEGSGWTLQIADPAASPTPSTVELPD